MTLSVLLTLMGLDQKPSEAIVNLWLDCLLDDDKIIRDRAFQVIQWFIHILRQNIFDHFVTHPVSQLKYSNEGQQKLPFFEPTHPVLFLT